MVEEVAKKNKVKVEEVDLATIDVKFPPRISGDMARAFVKKNVHFRNRGFILENYPRKLVDAQKLFHYFDESEIKRIMNKRKQAEAHKKKKTDAETAVEEENKNEDSFVRNKEFLHKSDLIFPDFVIWVEASIEWIKERLQKAELSEEDRSSKKFSLEELERRYKQFNEEKEGVKEYF